MPAVTRAAKGNASPPPGLLSQMANQGVMPAANAGNMLTLSPLFGSPIMDPAWKDQAKAALNPPHPPTIGFDGRGAPTLGR